MPLGVLTVAFDPVVHVSDTASVRLETIALALVLAAGLLLAARIASVTPASGDEPGAHLRVDDLVFIAVGVVPGALVGGRIGYVLDHLAFYQANTAAIWDPTQGALTLTLAVPLGMLTGGLIGRLLGAPVGRWLHAATIPLLFVLGAGKLAGVAGGTGQGAPSELDWATAYLGPGPWGSLAADVPSHPSQAYEAVAVAAVMLVVLLVARAGPFARRNGALVFLALALWSLARIAVASTWRDPIVAAGLRAEQLQSLGVLALAAAGLVERLRSGRRAAAMSAVSPAATAPEVATPIPALTGAAVVGDEPIDAVETRVPAPETAAPETDVAAKAEGAAEAEVAADTPGDGPTTAR